MKDYTVCITNFSRPDHLRRCLESVKHINNVVVACYGAGDEHRQIIESIRPGTRCYITDKDYGENRLLMQAVALADTPWVTILHDDDQLVPEFDSIIGRIDPGNAGFVGWDGLTEWYGERPSKRINPWGNTRGGILPSQPLIRDVTIPHGGMVRSPVTMMLRKGITMAVLSWCEEGLKEFHTRPTMMIGNEIALLFGHLKEFPTWFHVNTPMVRFGHWEGSETVKYTNGECPELVRLYDGVRSKFGGEQFLFRHDMIFPVFVHIHTGGKPGPRQNFAQSTWLNEYSNMEKDRLIVPVKLDETKLLRNSGDLGDRRKLPYLKDLLATAASFCHGDDDIIHLTNDDICMTHGSLRLMADRAAEKGSTYAHRRDFLPKHLHSLGMDTLTRPLTTDEVAQGLDHSGCDSITMTRRWWNSIGARHLPDFVIGCEAWDTVIIMLMRLSGSGWGWKNTTYHEYHDSFWKSGSNHFENPGQIHNRRLAKDFLSRYSIYRGEFEHGSVKDPAYPRRPPGCDTDPDTPVVKYMGDPNGFVPTQTPSVSGHVAAKVTTPRVVIEQPDPKQERAIVYPWHADQAKWQELRYSLRSVEKHFADKNCPIFVFGTKRPPFLKEGARVQYRGAYTYSEALSNGVQVADKVMWMNDDITFLKPVTWADCEIPYYMKQVGENFLKNATTNSNPWREGCVKVLKQLTAMGITEQKVYSTHLPYVWERKKALEVFEKFGVFEKFPMEIAYFHLFPEGSKLLTTERAHGFPTDEALFLNYADLHLQDGRLKEELQRRFPDFAEWEVKTPF